MLQSCVPAVGAEPLDLAKRTVIYSTIMCPFFQRAFGWCIPIGDLAGLVGLGGGEFRLPLLIYGVGFDPRSAVPLNLMVSFLTLTFALIARSHSLSLTTLEPHAPEIMGLLAGGMISAFYGASLVKKLSSEALIRLIAVLLFGLGCLLVFEAIVPLQGASCGAGWDLAETVVLL